jgi:hypothetical protein
MKFQLTLAGLLSAAGVVVAAPVPNPVAAPMPMPTPVRIGP